jgi:hypothetical protein
MPHLLRHTVLHTQTPSIMFCLVPVCGHPKLGAEIPAVVHEGNCARLRNLAKGHYPMTKFPAPPRPAPPRPIRKFPPRHPVTPFLLVARHRPVPSESLPLDTPSVMVHPFPATSSMFGGTSSPAFFSNAALRANPILEQPRDACMCMHVHDRACVHACMHACVHACMHTYMHVHVHVCMHACADIQHACA